MGAGNGCSRPAGAIDALRLWAGGYGCRVPAWNGCRPAGAIDALRLWAGGYGCRVPAGAIGVQPASGGCGCSMERMQASGGVFFCILLFFILFFVGFSPFS